MDMEISIYGTQQVWRPSYCPVNLSLINLFEIILQISRIFQTKKPKKQHTKKPTNNQTNKPKKLT